MEEFVHYSIVTHQQSTELCSSFLGSLMYRRETPSVHGIHTCTELDQERRNINMLKTNTNIVKYKGLFLFKCTGVWTIL